MSTKYQSLDLKTRKLKLAVQKGKVGSAQHKIDNAKK